MIKITDSHHKVLEFWAEYRSELSSAPRLISFDHHTDTSQPFRKFIKSEHGLKPSDGLLFSEFQQNLLDKISFDQKASVNKAIDFLNNDEHILTALRTGIISSALITAHNARNTERNIYKEHKIICCTVDEVLNLRGVKTPSHDTVLEDVVINRALDFFSQTLTSCEESFDLNEAFILDVDLDYFNTFKSIEPESASVFKALADKAGLVTIATEPEYVKSCALDHELTSEFLLEKLIKIFQD